MREFRLSEGATPNFHQGIIAYRDSAVAVVCARDAPVLAVAEPRVVDLGSGCARSGPPAFVDAPELVAVLAELLPHSHVLTASELEGPFDAAPWPHVTAGDVAYWRPESLGEALFNYWD